MVSRPPSPSLLRDSDPIYQPHGSQDYPDSSHHAMGRSHNSLDIILNSDTVFLRGTGIDTEPATLQGNVVLHLAEAAAFKEITMHFRGKSRVPNMQSDGSSVLGGSYQTNVLYTHDWSFLEGDRRHTPTLKAGRHVFPFSLQLDGSLPSSLSSHGGLAGVNYKLRATAVRPVFAANLHAFASVRVIRSFAAEALEYQQTLEVENTWPEKLMYSLMVPHKAWAAGDTITTLVKFSPLLKGVRISTVTTTVNEHLKTFTRLGAPHDETRVIATAKHEIRDGRAVTLQLTDSGKNYPRTPPWSTPSSPSSVSTSLDGVRTPASELDSFSLDAQQILGGVPIMSSAPIQNVEGNAQRSDERRNSIDEAADLGEEEVVTTLPLTLPESSTPSHSVEPVIVTHRIRWSILLSNPDGHTSELRCSLPLHILDHALLDEARTASAATRRLLFGLEDSQPNRAQEIELPSYPAHVLDRIANAYIPATVRVSTPWLIPAARSRGPSFNLPFGQGGSPPSHHSAPPTPNDAPALDWVNSELHRLRHGHPPYLSRSATPPDSTQTSRHPSRTSSRAPSPERGSGSNGAARPHAHHHHSIFSLKPFTKVAASLHGKDAHTHARHHAPDSGTPSPQAPAAAELPPDEQLTRAFNEVPHYDVASRGFLGGGVTPLSSMRGLPSYEEAERSQSEGDLAARFAASRRISDPQ